MQSKIENRTVKIKIKIINNPPVNVWMHQRLSQSEIKLECYSCFPLLFKIMIFNNCLFFYDRRIAVKYRHVIIGSKFSFLLMTRINFSCKQEKIKEKYVFGRLWCTNLLSREENLKKKKMGFLPGLHIFGDNFKIYFISFDFFVLAFLSFYFF